MLSWLPQSCGPITRAGGFLKGQWQLVVEIKASCSVFVFSFALACVFKENPPTAKKPRRRQHRFFWHQGPAAQLSLPAEATARTAQGCKEHKDKWATGLPVPSSVLIPLQNLSPRPLSKALSPTIPEKKGEDQAFVSGFRLFDDNLC